MKNKSLLWIILIVIALIMTACQSEQETTGEGDTTVYLPQSSSGSESDPNQSQAYPLDEESYPVQEDSNTSLEESYPISTEDLSLLDRSWILHTYREDGVDLEPQTKTININGNTYEIITEEGTLSGTWSARVDSPNPLLIFNVENGGTLIYEIITLDEFTLEIQTIQDHTQIEEIYLPID